MVLALYYYYLLIIIHYVYLCSVSTSQHFVDHNYWSTPSITLRFKLCVLITNRKDCYFSKYGGNKWRRGTLSWVNYWAESQVTKDYQLDLPTLQKSWQIYSSLLRKNFLFRIWQIWLSAYYTCSWQTIFRQNIYLPQAYVNLIIT